jgi:hypothetical protein
MFFQICFGFKLALRQPNQTVSSILAGQESRAACATLLEFFRLQKCKSLVKITATFLLSVCTAFFFYFDREEMHQCPSLRALWATEWP